MNQNPLLIVAVTAIVLWWLAPVLPFILMMVSAVVCIALIARMLMPP